MKEKSGKRGFGLKNNYNLLIFKWVFCGVLGFIIFFNCLYTFD